jgi:acyl-CoA hydrolase
MANWQEQYKAKLRSADQLVKQVKNGDRVEYSFFGIIPWDLDAALAKRKGELKKVFMRGCTMLFKPEAWKCDMNGDVFLWTDQSFTAVTRQMAKEGKIYNNPLLLHEMPSYYTEGRIPLDYMFLVAAPMDKNGYFNIGPSVVSQMDAIRSRYTQPAQKNLKVFLEISDKHPRCSGDTVLHISEIDGICESSNPRPPVAIGKVEADETDKKIAQHIIKEMPQNACLQFGIGGLPNLIGAMLCDSEFKDLGCHTEMFTECYVDLFEAGKLTNRKKSIDVGKSVCTFAMGSQRLYDFVDNNTAVEIRSCAYTNNPYVIMQNDNVVSICSCLSVDLMGNVSSESFGFKQISATGGQWDYHYGAGHSKNGRGFVCMPSSTVGKDGKRVSNIVTSFSPGTQVSIPGNTTNYVVTEYGCVNLKGLTHWERVEKLASVAHPDCRDEIFKTAESVGIWRAQNGKV